MIGKYNIALKTILQQSIESVVYGDLVINSKELLESLILVKIQKITSCYKKLEYSMAIMQHFACLDVNPIAVYSYDFLFNCMTVGWASDSMTLSQP